MLYEPACRKGADGSGTSESVRARGDRLLGVIVDDLGPGSGAQYKVGVMVVPSMHSA